MTGPFLVDDRENGQTTTTMCAPRAVCDSIWPSKWIDDVVAWRNLATNGTTFGL